MNILQVMGGFVPAQFGGTQKLCHSLSKELVKRGHEVTVYASDADIGRSRLKNVRGMRVVDGIKVYYFRNIGHRLLYRYETTFPLGVVLTARREIANYDVIHLQVSRSFQNAVVHHYARKHSIPYVLQPHGSIPRVVLGKRGLKWLLKLLFDVAFGYRILRDASRVIADTEVGVNEAKEAGIRPDRIISLPFPFDTEEFSHLPPSGRFRDKYGINEKHIVMFLGRIHWIKGLDFLVESFSELVQLRDDVILVIVGPDQDYKTILVELINRLGLSNRVLFTGFLGGEDKLAALLDADVVVQPSKYEQAALVPIEAVQCSTPIIVSQDTGAGEDVKRLDAGYLVEYGDKRGMVETIRRILDDPSEARAKTQKARDFIRANLSLTKMVEDYEQIYMECIEENKQLRSRK